MSANTQDSAQRQNALNALYYQEARRLLQIGSDDGDYAHPVFGKGILSPKLMLLGEAPGDFEARSASPFVGKAGKQLDELLEIAVLNRRDIFVTNTVKFRPTRRGARTVSNRTPSVREIRDSLPLLEQEIDLVSPRIIATLGRVPLLALCELFLGERLAIAAAHGNLYELSTENGASITLFPMYHPASAIYRRELLKVLEQDARKLGELVHSLPVDTGDFKGGIAP